MRHDLYVLKAAVEDLSYLRDAWMDRVTEADLRRGSAILRRFLVDGGSGMLFHLWREMGLEHQPAVTAPSLSDRVLVESQKVLLATAGGAIVDGIELAGYQQLKEPFDDAFVPEGRKQPLLDYVSAPCIVVFGECLTRREVVNYFANHLGGVHMSRKVLKNQERFVRLFRRIEELPTQTDLLGKDLIHFELLAIGQAIGQSEDCQKLAEILSSKW